MNRYMLPFNNQILGDFSKHFINWFKYDLFKNKLKKIQISTYDKAIAMYNDLIKNNQETIDQVFPYGIVDIQLDTQLSYDKDLPWKYMDINTFSSQLYEPILENSTFRLTPVFMNIEGTIETTIIFESIYDLLNWKLMLIQRGLGYNGAKLLTLYPFVYKLILSKELLDVIYVNDYLNIRKNFDQEIQAYSEHDSISYLGKKSDQICINSVCNPYVSMDAPTDSSNKNATGGELQDYRMSVNFNYRMSVPTGLILETDAFIQNIDIFTNITYGIESVPININMTNDPIMYETLNQDNTTTRGEYYPIATYEIELKDIFEDSMYFTLTTYEETDLFKIQLYNKNTLEMLLEHDTTNLSVKYAHSDILADLNNIIDKKYEIYTDGKIVILQMRKRS